MNIIIAIVVGYFTLSSLGSQGGDGLSLLPAVLAAGIRMTSHCAFLSL